MYDQLFKNIQNITLNDDSFSENDRKEVKELIASALNLIGSGKSKGTALAILASKVNLERANTDSYGNQIDPNFNPEEITETSHEDTTRYRFQFARDAAMTQILVQADTVTTTYQYQDSLDYDTSYFWRVMALEPAPSDWSSVFTFKTEMAPVSPAPPEMQDTVPLWAWVIIAVGSVLLLAVMALLLMSRKK